MLSNSKKRRKWSFEKGRNPCSVLLAAVVTAVIFALVLTGFKYEFHSPSEKRQSTEVSLILSRDSEMLALLGRYDSSHTYRINTGGLPFCGNCRRTHAGNCPENSGDDIDLEHNIGRETQIPVYEYEVSGENVSTGDIPASGQYAPVLPHPQGVPAVRPSVVVAENGETLEVAGLANLPVDKAQRPSVIRFTGSGLLIQSQVIQSSGDGVLDEQAAKILKAAGIKPGIYTVNWQRGEK